jgi:hypothetical protein
VSVPVRRLRCALSPLPGVLGEGNKIHAQCRRPVQEGGNFPEGSSDKPTEVRCWVLFLVLGCSPMCCLDCFSMLATPPPLHPFPPSSFGSAVSVCMVASAPGTGVRVLAGATTAATTASVAAVADISSA